jgi:hypothetical protein
MFKKYFYITLSLFCFVTSATLEQYGKQSPSTRNQEVTIEGLNFYPNPVSNGKVYITTKSTLTKDITIYDILGKVVLQTSISNKELNVTSLSPGVYVVKIKEGEATATRKLIIK